jgi:hypothetical protein
MERRGGRERQPTVDRREDVVGLQETWEKLEVCLAEACGEVDVRAAYAQCFRE